MKRWHEERPLMLRRWRAEIASHEAFGRDANGVWRWDGAALRGWKLAPLPPNPDGDCHCYRGPGYFRKRTPFGCSCWMCKWDKHREKYGRANRRRAAIAAEVDLC